MIFHYAPRRSGIEARCEVAIRRSGRLQHSGAVVMLTELPGNPGMSVTNAFEYIATQVLRQNRLHPGRVIWIEHYPERGRDLPETFDLVTLEWSEEPDGWTASHPDWQRISGELVAELLGESALETQRVIPEGLE